MSVLVDTTIWSLAFRRRANSLGGRDTHLVNELRALIEHGRVRLAGPVRQELLSGLRDAAQFELLRQRLSAFPDESLLTEDYEAAAIINNRCRAAGVAGGHVDFLLSAVALRRGWVVFTTDDDFARYTKVTGLRLHKVKPA